MKTTVADLTKALDYLQKHSADMIVRIDVVNSEVFELTASDIDGSLITIKIYDSEKLNNFAQITSTRRL